MGTHAVMMARLHSMAGMAGPKLKLKSGLLALSNITSSVHRRKMLTMVTLCDGIMC